MKTNGIGITNINIPECGCTFTNEVIRFTCTVDYENLDDTFSGIDFYITMPDGRMYNFYSYIYNPNDLESGVLKINVEGINGITPPERIANLLKQYGFTTYIIDARPIIINDAQWDGTKPFTSKVIQFTDIKPEINYVLTQDELSPLKGIVTLTAKYWNNDLLKLTLSASNQSYMDEFIFKWDDSNYYWSSSLNFEIKAKCNENIVLTLLSSFKNSSDIEKFPCFSWDYNQPIDHIFKGVCMNTNYPLGLHVFSDNAGEDKSCCIVKTSLSNHLVGAYTSIRTDNNRSVYIKAITNRGIISNQTLAADVTDNQQIDASIAPVFNTDDFVVVWTSNAIDKTYRIYARRFTVSNSGSITPTAQSVQISQSNGNYYAPRIVYNKHNDVFFVTWISVADKQIQSVFLKNNSQLDAAGYQGSFNKDISDGYFPTRTTLDIANSTSYSIALLNAGENIIAAYNNKSNSISIFKYSYAEGSAPVAGEITSYETSSNITNFSMAYDNTHHSLKIVYVNSSDMDVYGDTIAYFGKQNRAGTPTKLNELNSSCARPFIKRAPVISPEDNTVNFVVGWETTTYSSFINMFTSDFIALSFEEEILPRDKTMDKPLIMVTDNQIATLVQIDNNGPQLDIYVRERFDI
ncbi:TPA: hypothetical protein ACXZLZ_004145 [Salmonella enterica]